MENLREVRIKKLKKIILAGISPYPLKGKRDYLISEVIENFDEISSKETEIFLVGRIVLMREHGGLTFLNIEDGSGKIQVLLRKNKIGESGYQFFLDYFDIGDFIQVRGNLIKTKTGEKTLEATDYKLLAKSLRPLPEKWHGLKDVEERYRKRYLDLIFNKEVKQKFILRSKIVKEIRNFLQQKGFLEVETPILQPLYGGARARPFKTFLNALKMDLYLRIAPELYLKRLIVGGFEKVFEIGKCFRNEGIDRFHNPDFTMLEFYWAYADYKDLMKLTEEMFVFVLEKVFGKREIEYQGKKIDFTPPWPRVEFDHLFSKETKVDYDTINKKGLEEIAKKLSVEIEGNLQKFEIAEEIFKKKILPKIWEPTFVIHYPVGFQPLAKCLENNPKRLANFQLVVANMELVNAFSELNDPLEQRKRFEEQERLFTEGFEEAQRIDEDFLEALEYGMPPTAGFGMGIDRLALLLTNSYSLREIILFPTMRKKEEPS